MVEFKTQGPQIKSYWSTASLIHLHVVCGSLALQGPTPEQLETIQHTKPKTVTMWPFRENTGQLLIQSNVPLERVYQSKFKQPMLAFK